MPRRRLRRMSRLVAAAGVLAAAFAVTSSRGSSAAGGAQQGLDGIAPEGLAQIEALLREKETRTPAERKIDSQLLYARRMQLGVPIAPGVQTLEVDIPKADDGHIIVDVKANLTARLMLQVNGLSGEVQRTGDSELQMHVSLDQIEAIAEQPDVLFVQPRQRSMTSRVEGRAPAVTAQTAPFIGSGTGSVSSQGDVTHRARTFRGLTGFNGTGVKIGVLSNGVASLAAAQASGDLGAVTVLPGQTGTGDEGTAMLEIVHDMAPGAQLFFATGNPSITTFAQNIRDLRTAGCDIIVDDIQYFVETPFQDGQAPSIVSNTNGGAVIQAVKDVTADGALYFSAAGNSGSLDYGSSGVWEGNFVDGGATAAPLPAGNVHNFATSQPFDTLTLSGTGPINLYWSDPLGGSTNDYDLFRLNTAGTTVAASSTNIQNGSQDPYEEISSSTASPRLVVVKKTGAAARFLHLNTNRGKLSTATAGQTHGHMATSSPFSFGVAATSAMSAFPGSFQPSNIVETYSSDGPRHVFYLGDGTPVTPGDVSATGGALLLKPDLTAADNVTVSGAGGFATPFLGTSAAAPAAAAIAALIKSANPSFTQTQMRNALLASAVDIEAAGIDRDSGSGIVMALSPQPSCTFTLPPSPPVGYAGGTPTVTVTASSPGCTWSAWSNIAWISIAGAGSGSGTGPLSLSIAPNSGAARSGTVTIEGGKILAINQDAFPAPPAQFDKTTSTPIPDNNPTGAVSTINVSGLTAPISNVAVSVYVTHTFDSDLTFKLTGPDATAVTLATHRGSSGDNFGSACTPLTSRTTFDDSAATPIRTGVAPFVGTFQPEQPLAAFNGKIGSAANGTWTLTVVDDFVLDTGTLLCWSLHLNQSLSFGQAIQNDYDGDVKADLGIYRPNGDWAIMPSRSGYTGTVSRNFGGAGYAPVSGDFDGDRTRDFAVYQESSGTWLALKSSTASTTALNVSWGGPGYSPVPGDYDGDGKTDPAVYRAATGRWSILKSSSGYTAAINVDWGGTGYVPVFGQDFDGDGKADIVVYRQSTGIWSILTSSSNYTAAMNVAWGGAGYTLVPGDYDGDGKADVGVYERASGNWFILKSTTAFTTSIAVGWGGAGYVPVPADYDGDGKIDPAFYKNGTWSAARSSTGYATSLTVNGFGSGFDVPLSSAIFVGGSDTSRASDFDADGRAKITVYNTTSGVWSSLSSASGYASATNIGWGGTGYTPVPGDYDGDGKTDLGIYQQSSGIWSVLLSSSNFTTTLSKSAGGPGWVPVAADYDGDGKTDFAVYNTTTGQWFGLKSSTNYTTTVSVSWGGTGYTAAPGDFDGDGKCDLGVYQGSTGNWSVLLSGSGFTTTWSKNAGGAGYIPVQGDYDGDGKTDFAVYNTTSGLWFGLKSSTGYTTTVSVGWGGTGYVPVKGDYDGDGKTDLAIYQTSSGTWSILLSGSNYTTTFTKNWGGAGYSAVPTYP